MIEIIIKLDEMKLHDLFKGKILHFLNGKEYRLTLLPPNEGLFIDYEDWNRIKFILSNSSCLGLEIIGEIEKKRLLGNKK